MHLKRSNIPREWKVAKKGTKYLIAASHMKRKAVPLLIVLRDMLKIAKTRKEAEKILNFGKIKVNNKVIREEKFPLMLLDNLSLDGKNFRLAFEKRKFALKEISEKEAREKIAKIIGKKILKGKKMQINLSDGKNYLVKEKIKVGDSVVVDLKENKISEVIKFEKGCRVIFTSGKYMGEEGSIEDIERKKIIVKSKIGKINTKKDNLMAVK